MKITEQQLLKECQELDRMRKSMPAGSARSVANERYISKLMTLTRMQRINAGFVERK